MDKRKVRTSKGAFLTQLTRSITVFVVVDDCQCVIERLSGYDSENWPEYFLLISCHVHRCLNNRRTDEIAVRISGYGALPTVEKNSTVLRFH